MGIERARFHRHTNAYVAPHRTGYYMRRFDAFCSLLPPRENMRIFNTGCGSGELASRLSEAGHVVVGSDRSPYMIERAIANAPQCEFMVGGVEDIPGNNWDVIAALDVLPYVSADEEAEFFLAAAGSLKPDGAIVFSHGNMLVDLVTFNRYTVEFWRDCIIPYITSDEAERESLLAAIRGCLTYGNEPQISADRKSERDRLPKRRINPLSYPASLAKFGLRVEASLFTRYYPMPPQWADAHDPDLSLAFEDAFKQNDLSILFGSVMMMRAVKA